jgi:hypothetical protein
MNPCKTEIGVDVFGLEMTSVRGSKQLGSIAKVKCLTDPGVIKLKVGEESFNGRSAAFKPQQAPNFAQAAKPKEC